MSSTTPYLGLVLYDSTGDQSVSFATFRAVWGGPATSSNFYKIDTAWGGLDSRIDILEAYRGSIPVPSVYISANYYEATGITSITSYVTGMTIILTVDTTSSGTVTLNINALGTKSVMKVDSTGTAINLTGSDLVKGRQYLFIYDGTRWLWVSANSADQIQIVGTAGNFVKIGSTNNLEDSGYTYSTFAVAAKGVTNGDTHDHVGGDGAPITNLTQNLLLTGIITPSQITSNQNDYNPTSLSTSSILRLSTDAPRTITGLQGGTSGRLIVISNVGSFGIILANEDSNSSAANRFALTSSTATIAANQIVILMYDGTTSRWGMVGSSGGSSTSAGLVYSYTQIF